VRKEKTDTIFLIKVGTKWKSRTCFGAENEANNGFMVKFSNEKQEDC